MAMATAGKRGGAIADINVTPMADIMIVLLIIFMLTVPLLDHGPVDRLPTAQNIAQRNDGRTAVVGIAKDGTTYFADLRLATRGDLLPRLQERLEALPADARIVYLKADEALPYAEVMSVLDLCREAGAGEVALIAVRKLGS